MVFDLLFGRKTMQPLDDESVIVDPLLDTAADAVANQLMVIIEPQSRRRTKALKERLRESHAICSLLVDMVRALQQMEELLPDLASELVKHAFDLRSDSRLQPVIAGEAARAIAAKMQDLATGGSLASSIRSCQLLAIASCPNLSNHPEVAKYCTMPIVEEHVSEEIRAMLDSIGGNRVAGG
jgi:hypothetical protein